MSLSRKSIVVDSSLNTRAVRGGQRPDPATGAILTPIFQTATYVQEAVGQDKGHTYTRASNPTVSALEANLGALEDALPALCFSTGMAATHALFLTLLKQGDHVVVSDVVYGGTHRLLTHILCHLGIAASFVDTSDAAAVARAIRPSTRLIFIETPANPTLKLTDVRAIAAVAKRHSLPLVVDNTFLTPVGLLPLDLGADISLYSTTKHIEGHNATVGGALVTRDEKLRERLAFVRKTVGSIAAPFDSWLTIRGIKTLPLRLAAHSEHALHVARWLEGHPQVERVHYPGLESFPQHELAKRQHVFHGGILAFEVKGGERAGRAVMNSVELCSLAESLGSVETLITHPATMTHGCIPVDERVKSGISDGLIRLSVGLEDPRDIIADLDQALANSADERVLARVDAGLELKPSTPARVWGEGEGDPLCAGVC